ncbi:MAG TPA: glycosyltransferase family 39 protein [Anaerolineae bacterium]|nr:glycosyltransferase family 39 protein [Anaerolineae bacterium]
MMDKEYDLEEYAPWLVLVIAVIGGALRVLYLDKNGLWLDETFSIWVANHNVADMLQWITRIDQHPPLYYLLLHYWMAFNGDTPYYARLLSAIIGAGTIPMIYLIGKRLAGVVVGLIAAMILALSPFNLYYAQETRMYTLLMFNAAVAIYALVRLLTDARSVRPIGSQFREYLHAWRTAGSLEPDATAEFSYRDKTRDRTGWRAWLSRHRRPPLQTIGTDLAWVAFIVFSAATLFTHNTAVFFSLATNIFVIGLMLYQRRKKSGSPPALRAPSWGNWVKAQIAIFILWSPWIIPFIQQAGRVNQEFWIPTPDWDFITTTLRFFLNNLVPSQVSQVMTLILCALLVLGLVYYRKRLSIFFLLAALFAVPFLGELIVSIHRPIFLGRTLIWITIPLFLLLAAGLAQLRFRLLMIVALMVLITNYVLADSDYYRFVQKEDWSTAAGYVANFAQKDDLVLFNSNFVVIPFDYYFKAYEDLYAIQVEKQGVPQDLFESGILEPKMTENDIPGLISMLRGHNRVWLVSSHADITDPKGLIPPTLASQMKLTRTRDFYGGQVQLYETP